MKSKITTINIKSATEKDWLDQGGRYIQAHGGGFLKVNDEYYWFGEDRTTSSCKQINCYVSRNLKDWEFRNSVLSKSTNEIVEKSNFERPKVIYNEKTNKYVMWVHRENQDDYSKAECAVLICDTADGDYTWIKSFRPNGNMSRDCTLYKDDDGTAYFISAANENADLKVYKLTKDYTDIAEEVATLFKGQKREAPALCKKGDTYYMITSACTGWAPNQSMYSTSKSIKGPWAPLVNIGDSTTYRSQSTYILPIQGSKDTTFIYCADRWEKEKLDSSGYIWLPLEFKDEKLELNWYDEWFLQLEEGTYQCSN